MNLQIKTNGNGWSQMNKKNNKNDKKNKRKK